MTLGAAIEAMLALAAAPARQARVLALHVAFEARTGAFSPGDALFEARSAAFWDDALTREAFGRELAAELDDAARAWVEPLARAHRGLFVVEGSDGGFLLVDAWSGAEFSCEPASTGLRDALERASGLVDGRVAALADGAATLLPGAVFHHADTLEPALALLPEARARGLATDEALDALLRMDHAFRTLSRVKPAFAYRKAALPLAL